MPSIKLALYKALDAVWNTTGAGIARARPNRTVDLRDIDEIIINRDDRLGDAIISLPFLTAFIRRLRLLEWQGRVTVIASRDNHLLLAPLGSLENVSVVRSEAAAGVTYDRSLAKPLVLLLKAMRKVPARVWSRARTRTVFVDLDDSVTELKVTRFPEYQQAYWVGSNRGPFSIFFDFVAPERFAGSSKHLLVSGYIDAFSRFFRIPDLREFVDAQVDAFYPTLPAPTQRAILAMVGTKELRNFEVPIWVRIIEALSRAFPDFTIDVLDDPARAVMGHLEQRRWPDNVRLLPGVPLADLARVAAEHLLVVGVDGGGINIARCQTNSAMLFTFGNFRVYGPYLMGKRPEYLELANDWNLETTQVRPDRFVMCAWKTSAWLPAFQVALDQELVRDFDVDGFVAAVRERLTSTALPKGL